MPHGRAAEEFSDNPGGLILTVTGNDQIGHRPSDRLLGGEAVHLLAYVIPGSDNPIGRRGEDRIIDSFDDAEHQLLPLVYFNPVSDVTGDEVDRSVTSLGLPG